MNMDLTEDQAALVSAVEHVVRRNSEIPPAYRRGSNYYSSELDVALTQNGFIGGIREAGLGALEAALVVEAVSRAPVVVEISASVLVAPHVSAAEIPRPIVLAGNNILKPQRFLPLAKSMLFERDGILMVASLENAHVLTTPSVYGYPMGQLAEGADLSEALALGGEAAQRYRQWWRVAIAAEACGLMRSAVDFTVEYVKQRRLFGTTIGGFQAVQHRLAHAHRVAEALHMLTMKAAWSGDAFDANQAASFAQQHIAKLTFDLHQFNGAMGVSNEHLLHFWTYRLKALQSEAGGVNAAALDTADQLWGAATISEQADGNPQSFVAG